MEVIKISVFKATCLSVMERVRQTGQPVIITKRGKPIAQVNPPDLPPASSTTAFGAMADSARELGDIVEPLPSEDWDALR